MGSGVLKQAYRNLRNQINCENDWLKRDYIGRKIYENDGNIKELGIQSTKNIKRCLHPWVKVDQAGRPLPPKSLSILVGLTLKPDSLCIIFNVVANIWMFWFVFNIFGFGSLERFVLVGIGRNAMI